MHQPFFFFLDNVSALFLVRWALSGHERAGTSSILGRLFHGIALRCCLERCPHGSQESMCYVKWNMRPWHAIQLLWPIELSLNLYTCQKIGTYCIKASVENAERTEEKCRRETPLIQKWKLILFTYGNICS